ncbi:putative protein YjdF [bioreactor metagenome]|uniref:DUF2992 domain-containing protein n=1 Tax=bioreactor metagenome TaxID=1076179 RepID=A0A645E131_9ZZZZ
MDKVSGSFTLLFENPFWIGVLENESGKNYEVAKIVFGPEPTEVQLYEFMLKNYFSISFGKTTLEKVSTQNEVSYKRMQRKIKKDQCKETIGTKAQNAIKLQHESNKAENKKQAKLRKDQEKELRFSLKQKKKKEKHKGH